GEQLKKVELELGGKNPQIVCADADLEVALDGVVYGAVFNQGECCNSGSRVLVEASIAGELQELVAERARTIPVGDPLDPQTRVGAIASDEQLQVIEGYVEKGHQEGARLLVGGERMSTPTGRFYQPTVFGDVAPDMAIAREEIFGPVLSILSFSDLSEAIRLANSTVYGLSAGIWTRDVDKAIQAARSIRAGTTYRVLPEPLPLVPLSGLDVSETLGPLAERAWRTAATKVRGLVEGHPDRFPIYTEGGRWAVDAEAWTNWCEGFLGGQLWLL